MMKTKLLLLLCIFTLMVSISCSKGPESPPQKSQAVSGLKDIRNVSLVIADVVEGFQIDNVELQKTFRQLVSTRLKTLKVDESSQNSLVLEVLLEKVPNEKAFFGVVTLELKRPLSLPDGKGFVKGATVWERNMLVYGKENAMWVVTNCMESLVMTLGMEIEKS
jgi:hypothetical protein